MVGQQDSIVFMGTPDFAVPSLRALTAAGHRVSLVVTQPDRPAGRKQELRSPDVKVAALELGLPVAQPESVNTADFVGRLESLQPAVIVVAAFGQILGEAVLAAPSTACINVHASLLPRWRGASPIQHAIIHGDSTTGVSLMHVVPQLDAGDVIAQRKTAIGPDETAGEVFARLSSIGAELLVELLPAVLAGTAPRQPQNEAQVTYAPMLRKRDGEVDWSQPVQRVHDFIRGMTPWPSAFTHFRGKPLKLWRSSICTGVSAAGRKPGEIVEIGADGMKVAAGVGLIRIGEVQCAGRRRLSASDWARGAAVTAGERLGSASESTGCT